MKQICQEQLQVLEKIDTGFPDWKGDIFKHLSTALLNLARIDMESGTIQRPEFLQRVKEAVQMVQEGIRCKSCVKVARSTMHLDEMIDSMSDSEAFSSNATSRSSSMLDLR